MATKTFKIGLSDTDKQNMAQDVYERLIDMCFDEYDSANTYNEGDFVVYEDVLYKCKQDNVTGAWDSSKWETATFQDLVDDVQSAVASVNGKANIIDLENGTLVVAKAQIAQQIANVGDDVGSTQDEPFIMQATATDNGITSAETAPIAKHLEKQGNSVVVNQLAQELSSTFWTTYGGSTTYSDGVATFTSSSQGGTLQSNSLGGLNHTCLIAFQIKLTTATNSVYARLTGNEGGNIAISSSTNWQTIFTTRTPTSATRRLEIIDNRASDWDAIQVKNVQVIDLTQWGFNADEITDLTAHPENFFRYYQGSLAHNAGTLATSNGRYLKTIGRQQWDEEWELGSLDTTTGEETAATTRIRATNNVRVLPNTTYYCYGGTNEAIWTCFYDINGKLIVTTWQELGLPNSSRQSNNAFNIRTATFTTPANAAYLRFYLPNAYGTTYKNDITISLYYADGVDYDKYFAYEEHTYDAGTETLRSACSVRDIKLPSGEITRKVDSYTFTGDETWSHSGKAYYANIPSVTSIIKGVDSNSVANILCDVLSPKSANRLYAYGDTESGIAVGSTGTIWISELDYANISNLTGKTIYYELATPTTEQGTSFPENIDVDNYGSMLWLDTSNNSVTIPQGSQFFYPADYVEFIDSLYTRSKDGGDTADVTNIVVKSELQTVETALNLRVPALPNDSADGTYTLKATMSDGTITYVWVAD